MRNKFLWQVANAISRAGINIIFVMIMARYIDKSVHGTYAILFTINSFFFMFSQFGLGSALIQKEVLKKNDVNNAFFLNLFLGVFLYSVLFIFSNSISSFFDGKLDAVDIRLLGLTLIVSCSSAISTSLLQREFRYKNIFVINFIAFFFGYILVGSYLAVKGYGLNAFIFAQLIVQLLLSITSYYFQRFRISIKDFSFKNSFFFLKFGRDFTTIRLLSLISGRIDKLTLGKIIPLQSLAYFEKAQYLTFLPPRFLNDITNGFLFSLFSRVQNDNQKLFSLYASITGLLLFVIAHVVFGFIMLTDFIVTLFYGDQWLDILLFVKIFALAAPFISLATLSDSLIRSKNKFKYSIRSKAVYTLLVFLTSLSSLYLSLEIVVFIQVGISILYAFVMNQICLFLTKKRFVDFVKSYKAFLFSLVLFIIGYLGFTYFIDTDQNFWLLVVFELFIIIISFLLRNKLFSRDQIILFEKFISRKTK